MFQVLKLLGCGATMLVALMALYSSTTSLLGSAFITATIGVRQGSPTSCFLFILFVDVLIRRLKACPDDGWLKWLHSLMLMDDTVIFATTRERMAEKLSILEEYCSEYGMIVNEAKTKFMAINGDEEDKQPFHVGQFSVRHCDSYTYLGVIVTSDGRAESSLKAHVDDKLTHLNKLTVFLAANYDAPFHVKKKVFEAAFSSAILYSCEAWLKVPLRSIEALYTAAVKSLLSVRPTASNDLCLVEAGLPAVTALIRSRQAKFLSQAFESRASIEDDPLMFAMQLTEIANKPLFRKILEIKVSSDHIAADLAARQCAIRAKSGSKFKKYLEINPTLSVHRIYVDRHSLPDNLRITFTRFRTSSHRLRVELGRWSRTPQEQRVCVCGTGEVQDEAHLFVCQRTLNTRRRAGFTGGYLDLSNDASLTNLIMLKDCLALLEDQKE